MELTKDRYLRGTIWNKTLEQLSDIFKAKPNYMVYILSMAIGIMYDRRIQKPEENGEEPKSVPRNVLQNSDSGLLDVMFRAAILTTSTEDLSEDDRLELAFGDKKNQEFDRMDFLSEFANFGVTKLYENLGETPIETMENIKNFLAMSVEGRDVDLDILSDEDLLSDE